jgi:23S rRNA pseudouridine1911/1915/1917 synthase
MRHLLESGAPRLDRFLTDLYPQIPRSRWEAWIRSGNVSIDGQPATKAGTRLRAGVVLETELPEILPPGLHLEPEVIDLPSLFEDDRLWIIDKPAGMVVHPGPGHASGTVVNALLGRLQAAAQELTRLQEANEEDDSIDEVVAPLWPGLVHRLDRYTTGCLAMAKDAEAQANLQAQFKTRTVEKRYLALVRLSRKLPEVGSLLIDQPIARHRVDRLKMTIAGHGRPSQTKVKVLSRNRGLALLECELLTGRTHQIRIHLAHLGAPILGDALYGGALHWKDEDQRFFACEHPALHAWKLSLDHPGDGHRISVQAPLPEAYREMLNRLGLSENP